MGGCSIHSRRIRTSEPVKDRFSRCRRRHVWPVPVPPQSIKYIAPGSHDSKLTKFSRGINCFVVRKARVVRWGLLAIESAGIVSHKSLSHIHRNVAAMYLAASVSASSSFSCLTGSTRDLTVGGSLQAARNCITPSVTCLVSLFASHGIPPSVCSSHRHVQSG